MSYRSSIYKILAIERAAQEMGMKRNTLLDTIMGDWLKNENYLNDQGQPTFLQAEEVGRLSQGAGRRRKGN